MATTTNNNAVTNASMMRTLCKFLTTVPEEFKTFCAAEGVAASDVAAKASKHLAALEKTGKGGSPTKEQIQAENDSKALVANWRAENIGEMTCKQVADAATNGRWTSVAVLSSQKARALLTRALDRGEVVRTCDNKGQFWFSLVTE